MDEEQPGHLLKVGQVCKRFGVARQMVHEWIEEGRLYATYIDGLAYLSVQDVERIAQYRQRTTKRSVKDASKNMSADG
jgi:predicted site-specific integrase-resolvase